MNWRLLVYLSLFGFVMAIATVSFIPTNLEPILWLFVFGFSAYSIAKHCDSRFFFHGFILCIINCIYIVAFHTAFFDAYSLAHADLIARVPQGMSARMFFAATGPVFGVISGILLGLLSVGTAKLQKKI